MTVDGRTTEPGGCEEGLVFECCGEQLVGVLHRPVAPARLGVVIVVGGPQYRIGSHRQFVRWARALARRGIACLRFDYRGMGDSGGVLRDFEAVDDDIAAAVDTLLARVPELSDVALLGLCDAASAIAFHAGDNPRVRCAVLVNPWVRTAEGEARAYVRHYYVRRLLSRAFWSKLLRGEIAWRASARSLLQQLRAAGGRNGDAPAEEGAAEETASRAPLPHRVLEGLERFEGQLLFILSGNDLTAGEFRDVASSSRRWKRVMRSSRVHQRELPEADHTFSRRDWDETVSAWASEWLLERARYEDAAQRP